MLKNFEELNKIDILPFCEFKKARDDKGKEIEIPYLNWAKCKQLLHKNGANVVYFEPLQNENGSFLFKDSETFGDINAEKANECYFVKVRVVIDDLEFIQSAPLLNGTSVVNKKTLSQLRVANSQARAFVKGVAIMTGLGFSLWLKETDEDMALRVNVEEDLSNHNLFMIKKRIEQELTAKIIEGTSKADILKKIGVTERAFNTYLSYFDSLNKLEKAINSL